MPDINIDIPPSFTASMKQFMDEMRKFENITRKINLVQSRLNKITQPQLQGPQNTHQRFFGFLRQMPSMLFKFDTRIRRSIDRMVLLLGPKSRIFANMVVMPEYIFNAIKTVAGMDSLIKWARLGFRAAGWPVIVVTVAKWIWDKSIQLMEYVQRDRIRAMVQGTTVGGLRSFRAVFFNMPDDPYLWQVISRIRVAVHTRESVALWGTLGVKRTRDTTDMLIDTLRRIRQLMVMFPGQELLFARRAGLPISDKTILALLYEKDPAKFEEKVREFRKLRQEIEPTEEQLDRIENFLEAKAIFWPTVENSFLKLLVKTGFVDALTKLANFLTGWVLRWVHTYHLISSGGKSFRKDTNLEPFLKKLQDFDEYMKEKTKSFQDQLSRLTSRIGDIVAIGPAGAAELHGIRARVQAARTRAGAAAAAEAPTPPPPFIRPAIKPKLGGPTFRGARKYETVPTPVGPSYQYPKGAQQRYPPGPPTLAATAGTGTIGWWTPERANHAVERLMRDGGLSEAGAKALVARWAFEAPGGPTEVNRSSGAYGIAQWLGSRKPRALQSGGDFDKQIDWALEELRTTEKKSGDALRAARTPEQGAAAASGYERAEGPFTSQTMGNYRKLFPGTTNPSPGNPAAPAAPAVSTAPTGPSSVAPGAATGPGAITAAGGGPPAAFIVHHTSGRGTVAGVQATLRQKGYGIQYIVDRDGKVYQVGGPGAANIMPESKYRQTPILGQGQPFLSNQNIVGVEVIALNDKDVTPAQVAAVTKLVADKYPNTPVYGHGEVNPGHKEASEGMTIVNNIRAQRAAGGGQGSTAQQPAAPTGGKTMLFLHGMQSRYGDKSPAEIEAAARKYANAYGYTLEVIPESGDNAKSQLEKARERINKGGVGAVFGFSAGGYNAAHLRQEFPDLKYTITGAPSVKGDIALPNTRHMDLVPGLADIAAKTPTPNQAAQPSSQGGTVASPFPGITDFRIDPKTNSYGASRSGGGRLHSGNDLHGGPDGSPVVSMTDGVVLYNKWNQGYAWNIVIKGNDGMIRRYAVHGSTEKSLVPGTRVTQGQLIGHIGEGHVHYEEIPPMLNGRPNPVYQEFEKNASSNTFTDTKNERGTVDPSGPQGTLKNIGKAPDPTTPTPDVHQPEKKKEFQLPSVDNSKDSILKKKKEDPPQQPEEDKGDKLTHPAVKGIKLDNLSDANTKVTFNGKAGSSLADVQSASPMRRNGEPLDDNSGLLDPPPTFKDIQNAPDAGVHSHSPKVDSPTTKPDKGDDFSPTLRGQRETYLDELSKTTIRNRLFSFVEAEVGSQGNDAAVKWTESLFNRALSRHQTLDQALHGLAGTDPGGYWPKRTLNIGSKNPTDSQIATGELALRQTLMGSNRSGLATGNASGTVGFAGGPETSKVVIGNKVYERFGIEKPDMPWATETMKALATEKAAAAALRQ